MKTTVLTFEHEDGVLEHLTSQAPEDGSTIELISWGGNVWKRGADARYRLASIWVPDREKFDSTIFDSEDVEAMKERATRHAVESARLSATEIATSVAEEVHGLDLATSESFQSGFWIACSKIIGALNAGHSRFSTRKLESISVDQKLDVERIAYFAFETYNQTGETPWKTFDGRDVPRWAALNDAVRAKWVAAVKAIMIDERRRKEEAVSAAADAQRACDQAMAALRLAQEQEVGWRKRIEEVREADANFIDRNLGGPIGATIVAGVRSLPLTATPLGDELRDEREVSQSLREQLIAAEAERDALRARVAELEREVERRESNRQHAEQWRANLERRAEKAERDAAVRYDCKGGPGTTTPACGGCVTCLHRVIEQAEARAEKAEAQVLNGKARPQ